MQNDYAPTRFWTGFVTLGSDGIQSLHPMPELTAVEKEALLDVIPDLEKAIKDGAQAAARG